MYEVSNLSANYNILSIRLEAMIDNTAMQDQKCTPPFMHTALITTLDLNYRREKTSQRVHGFGARISVVRNSKVG